MKIKQIFDGDYGCEELQLGQNPKSAMISCNDGFRPVSFLIETMDEDSD